MNKVLVFSILAATAVSCGGLDDYPADGLVEDSEPAALGDAEGHTQAALVNGSDQLSTAYDAVVLVDGDWRANAQDAGCTGVLVSSRHVLTAAHCIYRASPDPTLRFGPGGLDWQPRGVWTDIFPNPEPAAAGQILTSGRKQSNGIATVEPGVDRLGYDYAAIGMGNASACKTTCENDSQCDAYTYSGNVNACFLKRAGYRIRFGGNLLAAPRFVATADRSNVPGELDFILLELSQPVPNWVAQPMPVLTDVPEYDVNDYLGAIDMRLIGFGGGRPRRQIASGELADFPFPSFGVERPNMLRAAGFGCGQLEGGDSGSPLLGWIRDRWTVVGIAQGIEGCGGRYVTPFTVGGWDDNRLANDIAHWLTPLITRDRSYDGTMYIGDADGDGKTDLLCHDQVTGLRRTGIASSAGRITAGTWTNYSGWCRHDFSHLYTGDFNGDGRMDLLCQSKNSGSINLDYADSIGRYYGNDWTQHSAICSSPGARLYTGDFNGDNRDDLLCLQPTGSLHVWSSSAPGRFTTTPVASAWSFCGQVADGALYVGDYNGDGRDDVMCHHKRSGIRQINYSNGGLDGSVDLLVSSGFCRHAGGALYVSDFDGDNRDDVLCHTRSSGWRQVDRAYNGFGGVDQQATNSWCTHAEAELRVGDFNGDGRTDLMCHTGSNGVLDIDYASSTGGFGGSNAQDAANFCRVKEML